MRGKNEKKERTPKEIPARHTPHQAPPIKDTEPGVNNPRNPKDDEAGIADKNSKK